MRHRLPLLALLASHALSAVAATFAVDDTGTVVGQPVTQMKWRQLAPGRAGDHTVDGRVPVAVRLDLSRFVNRQARIYMALAPLQGEQLIARWRSQGRLLPGQLAPGSRAVVFEGLVREAFLQETLVLDLSADGRLLERAQSLQFTFDIEVNP